MNKRQPGRPSRYKAEYAEQAFKLCLLGATDADLADFFGVIENTICNWKGRHPEFLCSLKAGKREADAKVAQSLYHRALGYEHSAVKIFNEDGSPLIVPYVEYYPPETVACIFWLKNRRPDLWRDKQQLEHSGKDGGPIEVSVDEIRERFAGRVTGLASRIGANGAHRGANGNGAHGP